MYSLTESDDCPAMKFFGFRLGDEGHKTSIKLSPTLCDMCECARRKKMENHKFFVRCSFDDMEKKLRADAAFYNSEECIWDLKYKVLQGEKDGLEVKMIREERQSRIDDSEKKETQHGIRNHTQ